MSVVDETWQTTSCLTLPVHQFQVLKASARLVPYTGIIGTNNRIWTNIATKDQKNQKFWLR